MPASNSIPRNGNLTVGRNTASSYRELVRIRPTPYPISAPTSPTRQSSISPRRNTIRHSSYLTPSPPKSKRSHQANFSDRFIPNPSSPVSLRHILSSPSPRDLNRDGSQSPTNPQLHSPGKHPEWPNSYDDTLHSHRLASALEIPISPRLLHFQSRSPSPTRSPSPPAAAHEYLNDLLDPPSLVRQVHRKRAVPPDAYRVLDAPDLRDDYYSQPLTWSSQGDLAVALGPSIFLWNPEGGVRSLPMETFRDITSVTFNSTGDIIAIGMEDGSVALQGPKDECPRVIISPISRGSVGALSWRPTPSLSLQSDKLEEILIIGTVDGVVVLLRVTWELTGSHHGNVQEMLARWDNVHNDQVCGIAWSKDGLAFATGANDNKVCTYEVPMGTLGDGNRWEKKFEWTHDAAIKGLAFKSGKGGILAAGKHLLSLRFI